MVSLRQLGYLYTQILGFAPSPHGEFALFDKIPSLTPNELVNNITNQ